MSEYPYDPSNHKLALKFLTRIIKKYKRENQYLIENEEIFSLLSEKKKKENAFRLLSTWYNYDVDIFRRDQYWSELLKDGIDMWEESGQPRIYQNESQNIQ